MLCYSIMMYSDDVKLKIKEVGQEASHLTAYFYYLMLLCKEDELVLEGLSDNLNVCIRCGFTSNPKPPECN